MKPRMFSPIAAGFVLLSLTAPANMAVAQPAVLEGKAAFGDWQADRPGTARLIKPQDLPPPGATPSAGNFPHVVARPASAIPQVPAGFKIELFADGLSGPPIIRTAPKWRHLC